MSQYIKWKYYYLWAYHVSQI